MQKFKTHEVQVMKFGAVFWGDRTSWPALREAALAAERAGFDSLWVDAHLMPSQGHWGDPQFDGWTVLSALGALTERATVGLLVQPTTFLNPGVTIKQAVTLDAITDGRVVLGVGAGYYEREHEAYGIEFGASARERLDRMEEALTVMRRLLTGDVFDHEGAYYRMKDALVAPRPVRGRIPILVGGSGPRVLRIAVAQADMWNGWGTLEQLRDLNARLDQLCAEAGRDSRSIERLFMRNVMVRATLEQAEAEWNRTDAIHGEQHTNTEWLQIGGQPDAVAAEFRKYADAGCQHATIPFREPFDLETIESLPLVREALGQGPSSGAE
jgi:alkanesulfonate monooxygenase SsuD/methylene tetrahydromethanopterin reductase-like flavin-dependent oxidoreductase (luciferase family)